MPDEHVSSFEHDTITSFAEIHACLTMIGKSLSDITSTLGKQQETLTNHEVWLRQHGIACPLIDALRLELGAVARSLDAHKTAEETARTVNRRWKDDLRPIVWLGLGCLLALGLGHASDLLKYIFR